MYRRATYLNLSSRPGRPASTGRTATRGAICGLHRNVPLLVMICNDNCQGFMESTWGRKRAFAACRSRQTCFSCWTGCMRFCSKSWGGGKFIRQRVDMYSHTRGKAKCRYCKKSPTCLEQQEAFHPSKQNSGEAAQSTQAAAHPPEDHCRSFPPLHLEPRVSDLWTSKTIQARPGIETCELPRLRKACPTNVSEAL